MEVKDVAEYEDTDSELAKLTIAELHSELHEAWDNAAWWHSRWNAEVRLRRILEGKVSKLTKEVGEILDILGVKYE